MARWHGAEALRGARVRGWGANFDAGVLACMTWPLPAPEDRDDNFDMWTWQHGRCAACGIRDNLVLDHDHVTGLERGYLCRRCNRLEGVSTHPIWTLWADGQNPATLLGVEQPYSGWGWKEGVETLAAYYGEPTEIEMQAAADAFNNVFRRPDAPS